MAVPPDKRCKGRDNGRQCPKKKKRREYCWPHYQRWRRKNGETRTERELRSIEVKAERRAELARLARRAGLSVPDPIFGKVTS